VSGIRGIGKDSYFKLAYRVIFDPATLIGQRTKDGPITKMDATVMQEIWNGTHRKNGQRLWYDFRPGIKFWNVGLSVGSFYWVACAGKLGGTRACSRCIARGSGQNAGR